MPRQENRDPWESTQSSGNSTNHQQKSTVSSIFSLFSGFGSNINKGVKNVGTSLNKLQSKSKNILNDESLTGLTDVEVVKRMKKRLLQIVDRHLDR